MRSQSIIGFFLLLAADQSQGSIQASCTTETITWTFNDQSQSLKTCLPNINAVDDEDFTISSAADRTTLGFYVFNKTNVKFLPKNLASTFPGLIAFQVWYCSVTSLKNNHLKGLSKLKKLHLAKNEIENVASDAFVDLVSLEDLVLYGNRIRILEENTFAPLEALRELDLDKNQIQFLHPKIFSELVNLEVINLDGNEISSLDENIFESLTDLSKIGLAKNRLERIQEDLFKNNLKLTEIRLQGNKIKFIDATAFDHLSTLVYVYLKGNECRLPFNYEGYLDSLNNLKPICYEKMARDAAIIENTSQEKNVASGNFQISRTLHLSAIIVISLSSSSSA